ncbi:F-box protein At2g26850 [Rosa rugosa]|uniref:F-box protein At2g26850 n=1 Tax=Rosa rugosa TaxID=74645 RepID=UPI002B40C944|nr:F-box protein At2g26850 [Rosa rugosa]
MLLYFFITCLSLLFFKSFPVKSLPLPPWVFEVQLLFSSKIKSLVSIGFLSQTHSARSMSMSVGVGSRTTSIAEHDDEINTEPQMCVLDLPELVLECILERLPAESLFRMRGVCTSLRERCVTDHLWEKHMKKKWGRVIGPAAYREWQWQSMANQKQSPNQNQLTKPQKAAGKGLMRILSLSLSWPLSWIRSSSDHDEFIKSRRRTCFPSHQHENSVMSWYLALETGRFWFPAQVYNRENGHVGFVLSCYDAELSYDPRTDTFQARYPPHGRRAVAVENCVPWERLRAPPVDTSPHDLHISDCLNDLRPGDHIEIQWRRNKEFPYGWWYGVVGHLESCDGNETYCLCHNSDNVVLEFNQYARGSRWRCTTISRKNHREEGDEADGFYGGIRKLCTKEEISVWKCLWPTQVLE